MAPQGESKDRIHCIAAVRANVGEGPVWAPTEQRLYWVDNKGRKIFRRDESGDVRTFETLFEICCLAPKRSGGFIAGTNRGLAAIDPEASRYDLLENPESGLPGNRFNDGKVDPWGRFWSGTMDNAEKAATGSLYRFEHDLSWIRMDSGYRVTNGPAFDRDRLRMYHTDSAAKVIYVFDLTQTGELSGRRVFCQFDEKDGSPDGMTVDSEGHLWVCFWDGWCIRRLSPAAEVVETIEMPVQRPTSCAFGGPNLDQLYVTSARLGIDQEALGMQPCAGGLFLVDTGVRGVAEMSFAG